jgi:hypothetical protein
MVTPKCPKCEGGIFSREILDVRDSMHEIHGICCVKCGAVVGTHEHQDIGILIHDLAKKLKVKLDS